VGSQILWPCSFDPPGLCYPKLPPLRTTGSPWDEPLRLGIHKHLRYPSGHSSPSPAQSLLCRPCPKACTALQDLCSARPCLQGLQHQKYKHTGSLFCWAMPPKPVKPGIHRHTGSPLHQTVPFKHSKPMLQRPMNSPQLKASTHRPMGPHSLATCHRKAPNLPKRHTQTGLDAKELASEPLKKKTAILLFQKW
jgi:hypothetical protein